MKIRCQLTSGEFLFGFKQTVSGLNLWPAYPEKCYQKLRLEQSQRRDRKKYHNRFAMAEKWIHVCVDRLQIWKWNKLRMWMILVKHSAWYTWKHPPHPTAIRREMSQLSAWIPHFVIFALYEKNPCVKSKINSIYSCRNLQLPFQ